MSFADFFQAATGGNAPYGYQCRLACGDQADPIKPETLTAGSDCASRLISIPTGLGKTAAVVLAWLWNRVALGKEDWPRRLVYCLPMRTLVEQTRDEIGRWIDALANKYPDNSDFAWLAYRSPVILMGGEENVTARREWDIHPEKPAILIGTQDMLLSRALNRGYGMARARWPMHFGLLNNDALWVMDETQLMGPGVSTAAQLEAFRNEFKTLPNRPSVTWYASATINEAQLQTRDWRGKPRPEGFQFTLTDVEKNETVGKVAERRLARKQIDPHEDWNFGERSCATYVAAILARHYDMLDALRVQNANTKFPRRTIVMCNTVKRATAVFKALKATLENDHAAIGDNFTAAPALLLMHSRFRQHEREEQRKKLTEPIPDAGQIIVATQVIEAGVDISSAVLWTEIAPLASLVQRIGRLNRAGEFGFGNDAPPPNTFIPQCVIVGLDLETAPTKTKAEELKKLDERNAKKCLPYALEFCRSAWDSVRRLSNNASPAALEKIVADVAASIPQIPYSLQRHELLDFFDTDSNLSLGFTDVSPFVRGLDEDTDIHVVWRADIGSDAPPSDGYLPDYQREELCTVPISQVKEARELLNKGWFWRGKETGWSSVRETGVFPGMIIMLPTTVGGYSSEEGWTGKTSDEPNDIHEPRETETDEDLLAFINNGWQSIPEHTADVKTAFVNALKAFPAGLLTTAERAAIERGIDWHDVGKNLTGWQQAAQDGLAQAEVPGALFEGKLPLAKFSLSASPQLSGLTGKELKRKIRELQRTFRPRLAHEVASALALRQHEQRQTAVGAARSLESFLAEYLVMSHHGHVRKVLRDELPRNPENSKDTETVRGIKHGDAVPPVMIKGQQLGCASLSTDCRRMGRDQDGNESYTRGVLRLLTHYGPFRLAFFEVLFRSADIFASSTAQTNNKTSKQ
ncbi:type I-G CRISPR-associated helicase/endonuclease Cas3g [Desulfobulbus propionicus]